MSRHILPADRQHPAIRAKITAHHRDTVEAVERAIEDNDVVVVGMSGNTYVRRARKLLDAKGVRFAYLEYGGYLSQWRRRNALKLWTGWPTFPMVFVRGVLVGGAKDLERLTASGELDELLG